MSQAMSSGQDYSAVMGGQSAASLSKDLGLSELEEQKDNGRVSVIGKITNNGSQTARSLNVQVNLFNHGKFVDQYSTYINGTIAPGQWRYFKVACGCKDSPPAEHDSFKAEILGGY